jgi:hypothetical protein
MLLVKIIQLNHLFLSCQKRVGPAFKAGMTSWEYHSSHKLCEPFWEVYFNGNHGTQQHSPKSIRLTEKQPTMAALQSLKIHPLATQPRNSLEGDSKELI